MRAPYSTCSLTETESSHYIIKFIIAICIFLLIYILFVIRCWLVHITIDIYGYTLHIYVLECETKGIHQSKWMYTFVDEWIQLSIDTWVALSSFNSSLLPWFVTSTGGLTMICYNVLLASFISIDLM